MQVYLHIPIYTNGYVNVYLHESLSKKLVRSSNDLIQYWSIRPKVTNITELVTTLLCIV